MPKKKTHKGLKKRVKVTANGKVKAYRSGMGHLMSCKSPGRCRKLSKPFVITKVYAEVMKEMLDKG
jgi:large subunit ribosomal protein L35